MGVRSRDDDAADQITAVIEQHRELVLRICRSRLPSEDDAEDAMQETFLRFLEADRTRIEIPLAWLAVVAVRVCAGWHRRRYGCPEITLDPFEHNVIDTGAVDIADVALDRVWLAAFGLQLPFRDYQLLYWLYVQRLSAAQVAELLGVTAGHVRVLSFRARRGAADALALMSDGRRLVPLWSALATTTQPRLSTGSAT